MIKVENISFSYKKHKILDEISLNVEKGELCSVIGINGSGKSTLIRLLGRTLSPSSGSIEVDGTSSVLFSPKDYAKKVSRLPQSRDIPAVSAADFIVGGRYPHLGFSGRLSEDDLTALDKAVKLTYTEHLLHKPLRELSGGERQRVYFAMILAQDTPYVLLDEPATYLDASGRLELYRLINMLKKDGKGVLSVSHDLSFALTSSDKLLLLDKGKAAFYGNPNDKDPIPSIEAVFGVKCIKCTADSETEYFFKEFEG